MSLLHRRFLLLWIGTLLVTFSLTAGCAQNSETTKNPEPIETNQTETESESRVDPDVPYVPTPQPVVERMLELANVDGDDLVYDLGSGDGRIVITAAEKYGAQGVGIDIDPERVKEARKNAEEAGVIDLVEFHQQDLFETDLSNASVVTLYLLPDINIKLRPKLFEELEPGTPVVSHDFDMDEWEPDTTVEMGTDVIYLWHIPEVVPAHLQE
jgi:SAM-dependent methyltransferase